MNKTLIVAAILSLLLGGRPAETPAALTPAPELTPPPEGISMTLDSWEDDAVTVTLHNDSGGEWWYDVYYYLDVSVDGDWYRVTPEGGELSFIDIACLLPAGESRQLSYDISPFGTLSAGTYRLTAMGMAVETTVK